MAEAILNFEIGGNPLWRIMVLFGIILIGLILGKIAKLVLQQSSRQFSTKGRLMAATTLDAVARGVLLLFAALGISVGLAFLGVKERVAEVSGTISAILMSVGIGYFLFWLADIPSLWLAKMAGRTESRLNDMMVPLVRKSLRVTVVLLVLVQIAQILSDRPITSIIAGLGIGGLAVALAAQDTLKNIFGSLVLFVDKPFELGDCIVVDGHDGPVEEVGLRSTKIRTQDGHLVTVPNGELANKTIQNIGKRPYIKRTANLTITCDTPPEKVQRALEIVKEILLDHEGMNEAFPPRVYFNELNADSLNLMVIYWYHPASIWDYMAFTERFNMEVFRRFKEEGIDFAFPTQTLFLAGDTLRPLTIGIDRANGSPAS